MNCGDVFHHHHTCYKSMWKEINLKKYPLNIYRIFYYFYCLQWYQINLSKILELMLLQIYAQLHRGEWGHFKFLCIRQCRWISLNTAHSLESQFHCPYYSIASIFTFLHWRIYAYMGTWPLLHFWQHFTFLYWKLTQSLQKIYPHIKT